MNKLDMNLFAFIAFLTRNQQVQSIDGLTINDGYEWYNYMWNIWLKNSDAGREMCNGEMNNIPGTIMHDCLDTNTNENITTDKNINQPRWTSTTTWDKLDTSKNRTTGKNNTVNISALREAITMYLDDVDSYGDDKQLRESIDVLHDFVTYLNAVDDNGEVNVAKWGDFIIQ